MERARAVMRTERAIRQLRDAIRCSALEEQYAPVAHSLGAQAVIAKHFCEGEHLFNRNETLGLGRPHKAMFRSHP